MTSKTTTQLTGIDPISDLAYEFILEDHEDNSKWITIKTKVLGQDDEHQSISFPKFFIDSVANTLYQVYNR